MSPPEPSTESNPMSSDPSTLVESLAAPMVPPISTASLPGTGGRLGDAPDDFIVDEIPLYSPCGEGEHLYVRLRKRAMTTPDLVRVVARVAHVRDRDIGVAGMKDKYAVTSQWISLPLGALPEDSWELPDGIELLEASRHTNKLRTGHQKGNRFEIRLIEPVSDALERAKPIQERLLTHGLPNYFGAQRFGREGRNLADALRWLSQSNSGRGRGHRGTRFQEKLFPSVIQSELFNRYLERRMSLGLERLVNGDVVRLEGTASLFVVENPETELPRLAKRDLHLTGPLPGPKMRSAAAEILALEGELLAELGLTEDALASLGRKAPGTRRDLLVWLDDLEVSQSEDGSLKLRFSLPSGSYATQLVREFTRTSWLSPRSGLGGD